MRHGSPQASMDYPEPSRSVGERGTTLSLEGKSQWGTGHWFITPSGTPFCLFQHYSSGWLCAANSLCWKMYMEGCHKMWLPQLSEATLICCHRCSHICCHRDVHCHWARFQMSGITFGPRNILSISLISLFLFFPYLFLGIWSCKIQDQCYQDHERIWICFV